MASVVWAGVSSFWLLFSQEKLRDRGYSNMASEPLTFGIAQRIHGPPGGRGTKNRTLRLNEGRGSCVASDGVKWVNMLDGLPHSCVVTRFEKFNPQMFRMSC